MNRHLFLPLLSLLPLSIADAAAPTFQRDIQPIFRQHCIKCHGSKVRKGGLDLRSLSSIYRGGESAESLLVAKQLDKSHLWKMISAGEMPPKGNPRLTKSQQELIRRWIRAGRFAKKSSASASEKLSSKQQLARQVQFILEVKCWYCHGNKEKKGGLDLRTRESILRGGKHGPAIKPGDPAASLAVKKIQQNLMPPHLVRYKLSIKPINRVELKLLQDWIGQGAPSFPPYPRPIRDDGLLVSSDDRQWWSFQAPKKARLPHQRSAGENAIDVWVQQRLAEKKLRSSPLANRSVLVRRLYFDLWGLPPTPAQVAAFVMDRRPNAYLQLVDRLLASPRFGERWGQHWLDAAGYSDSEGSAAADIVYPLVYRYRDYVVRSHNRDRPYDNFLLQQLAGDELHDYAKQTRLTEEMRDNLVATGYLRMCIDPTTSPETNFRIDRHQVLADTVEIVSSSLLGLTIRCARCHSHKYDPLPHRDYYRFTAIFAAAFTPHNWIKPKDRYVWLVSDKEQAEIRKFNTDLQVKINNALHERNVITFEKRIKHLQANIKRVPKGDLPSLLKAIKKPYGKQSPAENKLIAAVRKKLRLTDPQLGKLYPKFRVREQALSRQISNLKPQKKDVPRAHGLTDVASTARPFFLAKRGVWRDRGRRVLPNVPAVLRTKENPYAVVKPKSSTTGYRLALARWVINPNNPLTSRVMVNRIWRHYFARGLVATVGDFGRTGTKPSHPKLLDWLAVEFRESGWSMKHMHRLIVTSHTYRQASATRADGRRIDPGNQLLWRMPLRRKDAEAIRDSLLATSSQLQYQMYGPGRGVTKRSDNQYVAAGSMLSRSVYVLHRRSTPLTMLATFDAPRMSTNCVQRQSSNVVSQALLLENGETAERAAQRIAEDLVKTPSTSVQRAYRRILLRAATQEESSLSQRFLAAQTKRYATLKSKQVKMGDQARLALADLCLVLLNSAEFLYID